MEKMQSLIKKITPVISNKEKSQYKKLFNNYIKTFYSSCHSRDFIGYPDSDLLHLASLSFDFFAKKKPKEFKIRLYNPTKERDGFDVDYTILDMVNDDMPFLVDSTIIQFDKLNIEIKNIIHPIFSSLRSKDGSLKDLLQIDSGYNESVVQFHLAHISEDSQLRAIEKQLAKILNTVSIVVSDWRKMVNTSVLAKNKIDNAKNCTSDPLEVRHFIDWILDDHFIFLGCAEYNIVNNGNKFSLKSIPKSKLGIFRSEYDDIQPNVLNCSSEEIVDSVKKPYIIEILKSRYKSQIHRATNAERIRVQKIDKNGVVIGEYRFVGLFTSSVYYQSAKLIPIIRRKINRIILESGFRKSGHSLKDLTSALDSYPRDELFQIECDDLFRISMGITSISGRSLVRLFVRKDKFERFVSCLVFIPRDHFNTDLKDKVKKILSDAYRGEVTDIYTQITDSHLTRLHLIIRTDYGIAKINIEELENQLVKASRLWNEDLKYTMISKFSSHKVQNLLETYQDAFPVSYTYRFNALAAVMDIDYITKSLQTNDVVCDLYQSGVVSGASVVAKDVVELKIYSPEKKLQLSNIMPILSNFGFNIIHEHTYLIEPKDQKKIWTHYFHLNLSKYSGNFSQAIKNNFEEAIDKIWKNNTVSGHLDHLIITADLNYRQVFLLRGYLRYLCQIGLYYSQKHVCNVLVKHSGIVKLIIKLFEAKFNPKCSENRQQIIDQIQDKITKVLSTISNNIEDIVIRRFVNIINSTIRTNFFQSISLVNSQKNDDQVNNNQEFKNYVSFKLDSSKIDNLPLPIPYAEIFVFSPMVEGIHLRGGKVARGGLRWSDRHEDFRIEILGLMKAQMTKNTVIVPVGSKGGFVIKQDISGLNRDQIRAVGIKCYQTFLRGVLDITDNVVNGRIIYPKNVVRYDKQDPYLVVAADKGTATFSDIANQISADYNFWLGDAFASGGSVGYDHKKMGITAKGAWISVKRHFSEMGIDTQSQDFTCVGIGDMSGDVFGNGMLLSNHIRLVAVFNHLHIFLDPNPDSTLSFKERKRMFKLPRSGWMDYNQDLISKGGGVFERSTKIITITKEVKAALSITADQLTPNQLILAILKAPLDLLWNGGIGTYVKAANESHFEVGDRINDALRINGADLRCKVVGEGGNLGFTQKGRIEYALNGGKINTDAMDNSAGVDCSDHEVNIKIALTAAMKAGKISLNQRNKILESMTDEVANLVLTDNRLQTQAITIEHSKGYLALGDQVQFLNRLEKDGLLNLKIEFLPNRKEITKRQSEKKGMNRPELCVMLAYSKMDLYLQILNSHLIKDKYFQETLHSYFPTILQKKFSEEIKNHQLSLEIIATQITNSIVNRTGTAFVSQIAQDNGVDINDVVRNYIIVCNSFNLTKIWQEIESLDGKIDSKIQVSMFLSVNKLLERSILWLLRNYKSKNIVSTAAKFRPIIDKLYNILYNILATDSKTSYDKKVDEYLKVGISKNLANKIAVMDPLGSAYDIIEIAAKVNFDIKTIGRIYFEVGTRLNLKWLRSKITNMYIDNYWQKISSKTILEDIYNYQMIITKQIVDFSCKNKGSCPVCPSLESWIENISLLVERYDIFISDLKSQVNPDLSVFIVALNRIKALIN